MAEPTIRTFSAREHLRHLPGALGVPVLYGFGVTARGVQAADEAIELVSITPAYQAYSVALRQLLGADPA